MSVPELSTEQRRENLEAAKRARMRVSQVKKDLACGKLTIASVLEMASHDEVIARMRAWALIDAMPGYGNPRTKSLMDRLGIAESRRLKGLGSRQRAALLEVFGKESE